ncbi:MAG TPA: hypothetical protein VII72_20975 [Myxococcota bacterium]|jgi:hypothetical protein
MRANPGPSRILLASLLCAAFLAASLAPCPPRASAEHAAAAEHPPGCEMHEPSLSVTAACPCGCGERAPVAGSSARLGVVLPSSPASFDAAFAAEQVPPADPILEGSFTPRIDHVPLPA